MKQTRRRLLPLVLVVIVLLLRAANLLLPRLAPQQPQQPATGIVAYQDMTYQRPDMDALNQTLAESCAVLRSARTADQAMDAIWAYYEAYDWFYTWYNLADIRCSTDLTDPYWQEEYAFCAENAPTADAGLEELYYAAADSPARPALETDAYFGPGYFDAYEDDADSVWDEEFLALLEEEAALEAQYYELSNQALETETYSAEYYDRFVPEMARLFVQLVQVRQQLAAEAGYDSYPEFAYDAYYSRDYTPAQAAVYLQQIGETLYRPYLALADSDVWAASTRFCGEDETFRYVKSAAQAMGGPPAEAFALLEEAGLYDIAYSEVKYGTSFEVYLWSYAEPFVFVCPGLDQTDKLTFAHEFGHFTADWLCGGSYAGADVLEVHSQALEYLSLCYAGDTEALTRYKLADSLSVYIEQAAYALFEHQVYSLTGDALTAEAVQALYTDIGTRFGFDSWNWDPRDWVAVSHFFTEPMYVISYVVSNDLALQIYQKELAAPGEGLALYEECLTGQESTLLAFARDYGLESPFANGRLQAAAALFEQAGF